jgi:rod shape-determining protein MreC
MLRRPHYIALGFVVLVVVLLLKLSPQAASRFKLALGGFFVPLFGLAATANQAGESSGTLVISKKTLAQENARLSKENEQLRIHAMQEENLLRENNRLRELLGWRKQVSWNLKLGRVIARDPANWWRTVQIDLGSKDGVQVNLAVLTSEGLVGRVSWVGENRSQVILIGDPNFRVSALIQEIGETGVIQANSSNPFQQNMVDLAFLSGTSKVRADQVVITSGDGGIFPRGILIGRIIDWRNVDYGVAREARVRLAASLNALDEVWVRLP